MRVARCESCRQFEIQVGGEWEEMCGWIDIGGGGEGGRGMRREKMKYKENEKTGSTK